MLGTLESKKKEKWADYIDEVVRAYNVTKHDSTGFSPHYLMFAQHPRLPIDLIFGPDDDDKDEDDHPTHNEVVEEMKARLSHAVYRRKTCLCCKVTTAKKLQQKADG
jgi:hypothetical protein